MAWLRVVMHFGVAAAMGVAFVVGFLIGDRRGVRQANVILDGNMRELFKVIGDYGEPQRPLLH